MRPELKTVLEPFLLFLKIKLNYHSSFSCVFFVAALLRMLKEHLLTLHFACPMTQKSLNLVKKQERIGNCLMISRCLVMGSSILGAGF
jgi:hypothetical protein